MDHWAAFRFFGSLNDFLPAAKKDLSFPYHFTGLPAVKDAIEAIGVPHPEVAVILINSRPAQLTTSLQSRDQVEVYPFNPHDRWPAGYCLHLPEPVPARFVLDVHLGKLARNLRMLGFDAFYRNDYSDQDIAALATRESRLVLTRDIGLLKQKVITWGYWLRSQHPQIQLSEVIRYFRLQQQLTPFTRCLECNASIVAVEKETVWELLPPNTRRYFQEFYQCTHCQRVYWKGSHFERMQDFVNKTLEVGY
jgi:uncharacterized protein